MFKLRTDQRRNIDDPVPLGYCSLVRTSRFN
jgi:hypothetical protein